MALQLSKESPQGFSYNYHRISQVSLSEPIQVTVESYKDSAAREAGKSPLDSKGLSLSGSVDLSQSLLPQLYNLLKSGQFSGSQDC